MADHGGSDPNGDFGMIAFVLGGFGLLVLLWYLSGAYTKADLRGLFLNPLAPVGNGEAYGPTINSPTTTKKQP